MQDPEVLERLLAFKRSAAENSPTTWQEDNGLDVEQLKIVSWTVTIVLSVLGALLGLALVLLVCYCLKTRNNGKKKQNHSFGLRGKNYFRDRLTGNKPMRCNPTPVSNPSKGHYLKKTPSPTGAKSPPGIHNGGPVEVESRKSLLTNNVTNGDSIILSGQDSVDGTVASSASQMVGTLRRSSSGHILDVTTDANQVLGMLHCTIRYSFDKNALVVTVNSCENLPAKDSTAKSSDPYVKLQLLPEKQHKVKTRVMRRTLNPVYDEDFTFYGIHFNQLPALTLHFVVLSFDRYSRDDVIGEVMLDLDALDLSNSDNNPLPISREITPRSYKLKSQGRGEILVSLCYQPAANRITVVVLKARNLPKMDITGLSDPYVKIYLLYNDQRIAKKKTHVKKRTLNPVFNESFVFELPHLEEGLKHISLEFMLLDWDRVTKNEVIGRLELGGDKCEGTALHHWNEVLASPRRQIAEWHKLQE